MSAAIEARGLGKRYGRRWALADCSLTVPTGSVVGLVGPNGAGKSTFLQLAVGLLNPSTGSISVMGDRPGGSVAWYRDVAFVAQDAPVYSSLSVQDHLRYGAFSNDRFDLPGARDRCHQLGLDPKQRAGRLSGGQRAQLALTMALGKHPSLLVLDEPAASLDPLARREFLQLLMEAVATDSVSVVLSSHLIADVERVCDSLIVLADSRVQVAGDIDDLLSRHHRVVGPRRDRAALPTGQRAVTERHSPTQTTLVICHDTPIIDPRWSVSDVSLEDLVLAYIDQGVSKGPGATVSDIRS